MHTIENGNSSVPAFITKLWKLVGDSSYDDLISWSLGGTSFIIYDQTLFAKELLPLYFKHSNMASFIRQLNMYGFRKFNAVDQGGLRCDRNEMEFFQQYFVKGQEALLEFIKRKVPTSRTIDESRVQPKFIEEIITDVKSLEDKQETVGSSLSTMKRENESLWREMAVLQQKQLDQDQLIKKLIQFLVTMVKTSHGTALKRKLPLMIHDVHQKIPHISCHSRDRKDDVTYIDSISVNGSERGPVIIRDVTDADAIGHLTNKLLTTSSSPTEEKILNPDSTVSTSLNSSVQNLLSPLSEVMEPLCILETDFENSSTGNILHNNEMTEPKATNSCSSPVVLAAEVPDVSLNSYQQSCTNSPVATLVLPNSMSKNFTHATPLKDNLIEMLGKGSEERCCDSLRSDLLNQRTSVSSSNFTRNICSEHIEHCDAELSWLQDHFPEIGLSIDSLLGLFTSEDLVANFSLPLDSLSQSKDSDNEIIGNELIQYVPSVQLGLNLLEEANSSADLELKVVHSTSSNSGVTPGSSTFKSESFISDENKILLSEYGPTSLNKRSKKFNIKKSNLC